MATKVIFCFGTGTAQKVNSLTEFLNQNSREYGTGHEVHFFSNLNITPHSDPEETSSYSGNLDGKLIEIIKGLKKISREFDIKDDGTGHGVDDYILSQLGVTREEVLTGKVRVVFPAEDSGFVFTKINGDVRDMIIENPEFFGDLAEYATGLVNDDFILKTFERGFPGVETSPFLSAMGKENAIRFIKKVCELKGLNPSPKNTYELAHAMGIQQQSYLSYFLWYPGMKLEEKNLPSLKYRSINTSNSGIFTAQVLEKKQPGQVIEFEDCIIPEKLARKGDLRTVSQHGYPYMGPYCRHELFHRMMNDVISFEFMRESYNGNWIPGKPQPVSVKASDITPRSFDIALITIDGQSKISNRLKASLPRSYNLKTFNVSDLLEAKTEAELYEKVAQIGNSLIASNDCFIFEPIADDITPAQRAALSAIQSELITHKHVSPAHRNKRMFFLNENNCHGEEISLYNGMNMIGALADPIEFQNQQRLGRIVNDIDDDLAPQLIVAANNYFRVDSYNHGMPREIEQVKPYKASEAETVKSILLSASMRGSYYELAFGLTSAALSQGHTISWGLGDKVSMMGAVNDAVKHHSRIGGAAKATGCSTKDIVSGETRNGKGIPGIDGRIYDTLSARTFDLHGSSHGDIITTGGAGTLYEIDTAALLYHVCGIEKPTIVATFREDDPVQTAARRRFEGHGKISFVHGDMKSVIKQVSEILRAETRAEQQVAER